MQKKQGANIALAPAAPDLVEKGERSQDPGCDAPWAFQNLGTSCSRQVNRAQGNKSSTTESKVTTPCSPSSWKRCPNIALSLQPPLKIRDGSGSQGCFQHKLSLGGGGFGKNLHGMGVGGHLTSGHREDPGWGEHGNIQDNTQIPREM